MKVIHHLPSIADASPMDKLVANCVSTVSPGRRIRDRRSNMFMQAVRITVLVLGGFVLAVVAL